MTPHNTCMTKETPPMPATSSVFAAGGPSPAAVGERVHCVRLHRRYSFNNKGKSGAEKRDEKAFSTTFFA